MGNSVTVAVSNVSTTGFYAVGTLHNNGYTYDYGGSRFTLSCNGSDFVDTTKTFSKGQNVTWDGWYSCSSSTSARTVTVTAWWDSSGFGAVDSNSQSVSVTIPATAPSVTTPPSITNQKATLNSAGDTISVSWTTNGSGTGTPNNVIIDEYVANSSDTAGSWTQVYNSSVINSKSFSAAANSVYQFRMSSGNSAGRSSTVSTGKIYTKPATPSVLNCNAFFTPSTQSLSFTINKDGITQPSTKSEWQYQYGNTWYGPSGSTSAYFSTTDNFVNISSADSSPDSTLITRLKAIKSNGTMNVRVRAYSGDNSKTSDWATAAVKVVLMPQVLLNIPEGKTLKGLYINMPDGYTPPQVRDDLDIIQSFTTHNIKSYPTGLTINYAGKIEGPWFVSNTAIGYTANESVEFAISGSLSDDIINNLPNNTALMFLHILTMTGRESSSARVELINSNTQKSIVAANITVPSTGSYAMKTDQRLNQILSSAIKNVNLRNLSIKISNISSQADLTFIFPCTGEKANTLQGYTIL